MRAKTGAFTFSVSDTEIVGRTKKQFVDTQVENHPFIKPADEFRKALNDMYDVLDKKIKANTPVSDKKSEEIM